MERYRGGLIRTSRAWVVEFPKQNRDCWEFYGRLDEEPERYVPTEAFNAIMEWEEPKDCIRYVRLEHMVGRFTDIDDKGGEEIWETYGVYDLTPEPGVWIKSRTTGRRHYLLHWQGSTACGSILMPGWTEVDFDVSEEACDVCLRNHERLVRQLSP